MGFGEIDGNKDRTEGYVEANDYALPYLSRHFSENRCDPHDTLMLKHVNCGYLSTPGRPPTLAALKKHAQSLTYLISRLAPPSSAGEIDNVNLRDPLARPFVKGEAYDFLNNLHEPYTNDEPFHHRPLNSLVNVVQSNNDIDGVGFHCPLEHHPFLAKDSSLDERLDKPYASHENLLMHANECLEMLDHEFSATGGILSILPTDHELEAAQLEDAKSTLVGQWLLYTQQLVSRMHDLERAYANNLDLLAGEAVVPMQHMSAHGPDGRSGREIVFPQDRWILANAGDDVLEFLHHALDKKEVASNNESHSAKTAGAAGEALNASGKGDRQRGIVHLDLNTRYYRLKGDERGPIFILPAYADRPGTAGTRDLEKRPTVVTVPMPKFPERITEWEKKARGKDDRLKRVELELDQLRRQNANFQRKNDALMVEAENQRQTVNAYRNNPATEGQAVVTQVDRWKGEINAAKLDAARATARAYAAENRLEALLPNEYSWEAVAGVVPRDVDGNVTDRALAAMLRTMKKIAGENEVLKKRLDSRTHQFLRLDRMVKSLPTTIDDSVGRSTAPIGVEAAANAGAIEDLMETDQTEMPDIIV